MQRRSGSWLDPELVAAFLKLSAAPEFWLSLAGDDIEQKVLALEPASGLVMVDEDYLDAIVAAFGQVIDAKSPYTSGHSDRVGHYCDLVAAELGYDEHARRSLRRAAMLHDVGKLGVSSTILEKPGKLEADEWHVMQSHATHTLRILQRVGVLSGMASIAAAHHERLDGKGYPHNLDATDDLDGHAHHHRVRLFRRADRRSPLSRCDAGRKGARHHRVRGRRGDRPALLRCVEGGGGGRSAATASAGSRPPAISFRTELRSVPRAMEPHRKGDQNMRNLLGMLVGAAIDRGDGDSGLKGAIIGSIVQSTARVAMPVALTFAVGWGVIHLARRGLARLSGDAQQPAPAE